MPSHAKLALVAVLHKEELGARIRRRRKELGYTQKKLAELAHYKEGQTVSRWERGVSEPEDLPAVAAALQWTVSEMLDGIEMTQEQRQRLDPEGATQLDRMEHELRHVETKLDALLAHFQIETGPDIIDDAAKTLDPGSDVEAA